MQRLRLLSSELPVNRHDSAERLHAATESIHRAVVQTDAALIRALRDGERHAAAALFDRYGVHVQRILMHVLGYDQEVEDLVHEVFMDAWRDIPKLRDDAKLKPWLTRIAVNIGRDCIRRRTRRKWLLFRPTEELPEIATPPDDHEAREELRCAYRVLDQMPVDLRTAFVLRFVDELDLAEVAHACNVSLATVKRRLQRGEKMFGELARATGLLVPWTGNTGDAA